MPERVLQVSGLHKDFGRTAAVDGIDLDMYEGEVLALLGPSGCGKSTTLRLIAGLEVPSSGTITIRDRVVAAPGRNIFVPPEHRNLGLVFQSYAIWPHMTVAKNIGYPLEVRRWTRERIARKVEEVLALVGMAGFESRPATQLSGGQQQRVALARALAYEPDILLLDEPLSNLDAQLRNDMRFQIKALQRRLNTTILYVTHDQVEAMSLADRIAIMRGGQIEQLGTPREIYEEPASFFAHSFVGRVIALPVTGRELVRLTGSSDQIRADAGREYQIAVRQEDIRIEPIGQSGTDVPLRAQVLETVYCGDHIECALQLGETTLTCDAPVGSLIEPGQEVALNVDREKIKSWPVSP